MSLSLFVRVVTVECLKLKRTLALGMVVLAPVTVVILHGLILYAGGERSVRGGGDAWSQLCTNSVSMWTLLMMPMFVTLETSLLAGLEHNGNWKAVLTLPAPRWAVYIAKLLVAVGLLWMAHVVLFAGTLASASTLRLVQPSLKLDALPLDPLFWPLVSISTAALLGLAIQHWVSIRWASFTAAIGFGMFAMITGFVFANAAAWGRLWPWSLAIHSVRPNTPGEVDLVLAGMIGAIVVALLGSIEFSRRDIP